MKDSEIDGMLAEAGKKMSAPETCGAAVAKAEAALLKELRPARRFASPPEFALIFLAVFAAVALLFAGLLGLGGVHALSIAQRANIFPILLAAAGFAAVGLTREMRPGSGRHLGVAALAVFLAGFPLLFLANFRSLGLAHFVSQGWPCLKAGVVVAIPAGAIAALILRRGFVLSWKMAGLAAGTFAGLTGLAMLELHCPNLNLLHILVWHVAVVATCGLLGLAAGWVADLVRSRGVERLHP